MLTPRSPSCLECTTTQPQIVGTIEAAKALRSEALVPSRARMAMAYRMAPAIRARAAGVGFFGEVAGGEGALQALLDRRQQLVGDGGDPGMAGRFDGRGAHDHAARPVRRRGVEIDRGLVDLAEPLLDRARAAQDRVEALDALVAVEAQRRDVELLLVAERRIEAGAVESRGGRQLVERGGGEALFHEHRAHAVKYLGGNEAARPAARTFGYFCTGSHNYP